MFEQLRKELLNHMSIGIFSHVRPDGDCIGAQVAMARWLEANGIFALAFNDDEVPSNLEWLVGDVQIHKPDAELTAQCDAFLVLDGNAPHRFGSYEEVQRQFPRPSFMIDHHPDPTDDFDESVCDDQASSTCELVHRLYMEHDPAQLDELSAKALYTGILTDTGSLQYESVTAETVTAVADLLRRGNFRPNEIVERVYATRTPQQLKLLSRVLDTLKLYEGNQIAIMTVTSAMLDETGTASHDCDGFVNFGLSLSGVRAAVLIKELDGVGIRMSLRSKGNVDVNEWARQLGGGGHKKASGARHDGPMEEAIRDVVRFGALQVGRADNE
ncbi:MAG: bifunctional oligoribonuclease/PAP phosphatase NrnA [Balneolaceae bacterium]